MSLHRQKDPNVRNKHLKLIFNNIPDRFRLTFTVCAAHFSVDCFVNLSQCNAGFAKRLSLNDEAEPTISHPTANFTCEEGIYMEVLKAQWQKVSHLKLNFKMKRKSACLF